MEGSSSSSPPHCDVFISHRGADVKNTLASIIYHWLHSTGLQVFFDKEELPVGDGLLPTIETAIRTASVHLAIFSKNYAESKWCLDELSLMLDQPAAKIIPVFYDVRPADLRWPSKGNGAYAAAFAQHKKNRRVDSQTLSKWEASLQKVADISGLELHGSKYNGDQGLLLRDLVDSIMENVKKEPQHLPTDLIGVDESLEDFEKFMLEVGDQKERPKIVGIVGLPGSGKTTLAKEFYNCKRPSYNKTSFLLDVREAAARGTLPNLQTRLLKDLLPSDRSKATSTDEGRGILRSRLLPSSRVLIVLDDIGHQNQVEDLLGKEHAFGSGSLIILTSRDESALRLSGVGSVYKIKGLPPKHAQELFCAHAFFRRQPINGFEDLVEKFCGRCQGLPLFLKVMGSHLRVYANEDTDNWEEELKYLPDDIRDILKHSYDALHEEEKQIFLDVGCFFVGENKDTAIRVWAGSGWRGSLRLQNLRYKSLVELDDRNCLRMHDHVRDFAREIANKESPCRVWCEDQASSSFLGQPFQVRGIVAATGNNFHGDYYLPVCTSSYPPPFEEIEKPEELRLLVINGNRFDRKFGRLSKGLAWLRWYNYPFRCIPAWLSGINLRVLQLYSEGKLEELWKRAEQAPLELRELVIINSYRLSGNPKKVPKSIVLLKHLEKVILFDFLDENLPDEFGELRSLRHLEIWNCGASVTSLPRSFGQLTQLQYLVLRNCRNLIIQPHNFENITKLERLILNGCEKLEVLPLEVTRQRSLKMLDLFGSNLGEVPYEIGQLCSLQHLRIGSPNPFLTSLLPSLGNLTNLTMLELLDCEQLTCLPESLGQLKRLTELNVMHTGIEYLPRGFEQLSNLQTLRIKTCPLRALTIGGRMDQLRRIYLWSTPLSKVSIAEEVCPNLKCLDFLENNWLKEVENLPRTLIELRFRRCQRLKKIPGVSNLAELQKLEISNCWELDELPNLGHLSSMQTLEANACFRLQSIQGLDKLQQLMFLNLSVNNRAMWNSIRSLFEMLPPKLSTLVFYGRRETQNSLSFLDPPVVELDILEEDCQLRLWSSKMPTGALKMSWKAAIICFAVHGFPVQIHGGDPESHILTFYSYAATSDPTGGIRVNIAEGEWIVTIIHTEDSLFMKDAKESGYAEIMEESYPCSSYEIKKGAVALVTDVAEMKILEALNKLFALSNV